MLLVIVILVAIAGLSALNALDARVRARDEKAEDERRATIRAAIEEGRVRDHTPGELLEELFSMIVNDQVEIATAVNRLVKKLRGPASSDLVERPAVDARNLFDDMALRLDARSVADSISTLAFILQITARQLQALRREEGFLPVFAYLLELRQAELDVVSGRRALGFESYPAAIALLCDLWNGTQENLVRVVGSQAEPPRRRGRPRRRNSQ